MTKYMAITKFTSMHEYQEIVDLANGQKIYPPTESLPTKEQLVKYILDNGFKLGGGY